MWHPTRPPAQQCGDGGRDLDLIDQSGVSCRQGYVRTGPDVFYLLPGTLPGAGVGGPGALTGGENRLPPVGLIDFSVGVGGGGAGVAGGGGEAAGDVVAGVVGVVGSGAFSSRAQAESTPMAMIAPMPAVVTRRRAIRPDLMMPVSPSAGQRTHADRIRGRLRNDAGAVRTQVVSGCVHRHPKRGSVCGF